MANFRGLLHHKPVRIFFFTKCTNIILVLLKIFSQLIKEDDFVSLSKIC